MSSVSRSTPRGGKGGKLDSGSGGKPQKTDAKSDSPKAVDLNPKMQPTAEQMRIAQIIDTRMEDPDLKDKIKQAMDATRKTEDEVCTALHDCDNDLDRAVNMLIEGMGQGEWELSGKKKKNRQPSTTSKSEATVNNRENQQGEWSREREPGPERERSRNRGGGPPRMRGRGSSDSRGWRGRENKENEKNLEDSRDGPRRGGRMMNGPGRSGRGGRGGRLGPRTFQNREKGGFPRSIDTWNNPQVDDSSGDTLKMDKWGDDFPSPEDWDNEEYTGSLADTKVFTPSTAVIPSTPNSEPLQDSTNQDITCTLSGQTISSTLGPGSGQLPQSTDFSSALQAPSQSSQSAVPVGVGVMTPAQSQYFSQLTQASESLRAAVGIGSSSSSVGNSSSSFSAIPSSTANGYSVTSSTAVFQPASPSSFTSTTASFSTSSFGGSAASYSSQIKVATPVPPPVTSQSTAQSMPARTKTQRPRVPPPSKIPSSAVEMPGDAINSSISFLDVQFGGLEFGSETSSFDFTSDQSKYAASTGSGLESVTSSGPTSNMDLSVSNAVKNQPSSLDGYTGSSGQQTNKESSQTSLPSPLGHTQKLSGPETVTFPSSQTADHKSGQSSYSQQRGGNSNSSGLEIGKSDSALSFTTNTGTYQPSYQNQKSSAAAYQSSSSYSASSNYTPSQVQASSAPYVTGQSQGSFPSSQSGSGYSSQQSNSFPSSQAPPPTSYPSSQTGSSYTASQVSASSYQQPGQAGASFQSVASFPSISQSGNAYPNSTQSGTTYQTNNPAGYATSSLNQSANSGYTTSTGTSQYQNTYGSSTVTTSQSHSTLHGSSSTSKLGGPLSATSKDSQYETTTTASSSLSSTIPTTTSSALSAAVNVSPALGLATTSQTVNVTNAASTKVSSSTGKAGVLPNMPPGVPPMLGTHQYIMSQAGLPYFAGVQQPVYSYEDFQLLQQRIPHLTAGYYDMGFQAPTSLASGREGGLASVAYSVSDGRFARTDNNSSPVQSTLSQQNPTQTHQQPMMNAPLPPGYAYFYGSGMMPGSFQYGTPAIYPMPTATNAHGATNNTQYPKPGSYGSGYVSGYESLSQNQDYGKTGYVSSNQSQSKGGVGGGSGTTGSSGSDMSAAMYGKTHAAIGKVNSYDKQGFHSGTPPPFNMPGTQTAPMGAPSGYTQHLFIPTMAPHQQHHSTTLIHQPLHQMEMRNPGRRSDSGSASGQRSQTSSQQNKSGAKAYNPSFWTSN